MQGHDYRTDYAISISQVTSVSFYWFLHQSTELICLHFRENKEALGAL